MGLPRKLLPMIVGVTRSCSQTDARKNRFRQAPWFAAQHDGQHWRIKVSSSNAGARLTNE
jgi:hypothetical protein